ncbi:MAG: ParA family protein [Actinobacteria bacterium]|nr:ParA family protein [Actinomycetota bacterium]MCB9389923.1 ParA family protein [Acidimicrobiia bacterium]
MARILTIANQKGGVAKTTTTLTLGAALAELGERVLLVDLDPQACLTFSCGVDPDGLELSLHDMFVRRKSASQVIVNLENFDLLPANIDLAGSEMHLLTKTGREHALARALMPARRHYDTILIDCPPSLGVLTINGLTAAEQVIIPMQCETLSHRGVGQLLETIEDVRAFTNSELAIRGIVATMYDGRTRHSREILDAVTTQYQLSVLEPPVRKSVRFAEAPQQGKTILDAGAHPGADAYRAIAATLHAEGPSADDSPDGEA